MMEKKHRRPIAIMAAFTALLAIFGWATFATLNADHKSAKPQPDFVTADQALAQLEQGNRRCVEGRSSCESLGEPTSRSPLHCFGDEGEEYQSRRRDLPNRLGKDHIPR